MFDSWHIKMKKNMMRRLTDKWFFSAELLFNIARDREEPEGCDAVDEPGGGGWPHLTSPGYGRLVKGLGGKDDVLGAEGLVRAGQCMVGSGTQGLCYIAVGLGLPAQELTSSFPEQLGELVFGRHLEGAEEEEETAIEERWELRETNY